jgi:hypothetical protein
MSPLILSGLALVLLGAALWCLRQMREVLAENCDKFQGGEGAAFGYFLGAVGNGIAFGFVLHRLGGVLP